MPRGEGASGRAKVFFTHHENPTVHEACQDIGPAAEAASSCHLAEPRKKAREGVRPTGNCDSGWLGSGF